jgi:NAD(P)H-hydrate epimerase
MIPHYKGNLPFITSVQMKEVDRIMTEEYGITLSQMMENAGLNLAVLARDKFLIKDFQEKKVIVVAGTGGNGGGVLAAARRLKNWGINVSIILTDSKGKFKQETIAQFSICQKMEIPVINKITDADLIIDGMIGYGIDGDPKEKAAWLINQINESGIPVLSLDAPSGLDLTTGKPGKPTIKAKATLSLALPKIGLFKLDSSKYIGELFLADISVPPELYDLLKIESESLTRVFREGTLVKINKVIVFS